MVETPFVVFLSLSTSNRGEEERKHLLLSRNRMKEMETEKYINSFEILFRSPPRPRVAFCFPSPFFGALEARVTKRIPPRPSTAGRAVTTRGGGKREILSNF
jgi:hypothetical protein